MTEKEIWSKIIEEAESLLSSERLSNSYINKFVKDLKIKGITKNLKHAAVEIGLPGNPKKHLLLINLANIIGFPGLIETPLNISFGLNCLIIFGIKSNFPADIAPEVIIISLGSVGLP